MWDDLCHAEAFRLFCAYPKAVFKEDVEQNMHYVCSAHSKVVPHPSPEQVLYKDVA
jgi:hypothetical protein